MNLPRSSPPLSGLARRLLRRVAGPSRGSAMADDLDEEYRCFVRPGRGSLRAAFWYWSQVARSWMSMLASEGRGRGAGNRRGGVRMETASWVQDVRFALRGLRRHPVFTVTAVLTLALGVGGTAAIHAVLQGTLFRPLPYPDAERIQVFWDLYSWQPREFALLRDGWEGFESVGAFWPTTLVVQADDGPARAEDGLLVTHEIFDVLGREPIMGRTLSADDEANGGRPVVVIAHGLWQELGGTPEVLERTLRVNGMDTRIVGVMPPDFWFLDAGVRVWQPIAVNPEQRSGFLALLGRLGPGVDEARTQGELDRITRALGEVFAYPLEQWDRTRNPGLTPLKTHLYGDSRRPLLLVAGALGLTLLMAAANVAALLLARTDARRGELALRRAVGAGAPRLARQLWTETVVLGAISGLGAAGVGALGFRLLRGMLPVDPSVAATLSLDVRFMGIAVLIGVLTGALVGLGPSLAFVGARAPGRLGRRHGTSGGRLESGLVVVEVALALLLVAGAGLLIRSVHALSAIDTGIRSEGVLVADLVVGRGDFPRAELPDLYRRVVDRAASVPGVDAAGLTQKLPLRGVGWITGITLDDGDLAATARYVTPGYLEALGVPLLSGRALDRDDAAPGAELVALVNRTLADRIWPGEDPLGRTLPDAIGRELTVVGVVGDVKEGVLTDPPMAGMYASIAQASVFLDPTLVVRTRDGAGAAVAPALRTAIQAEEPRLAVQAMTTLDEVVEAAQGEARQVMRLLAVLGGLALVVGGVGVYGVLSHWVSRRRRAWAVSVALGASRGRLIGSVIGRAASLVLVGVALGGGAFALAARGAESLLHDVQPFDPLALGVGALALLTVGGIAAVAPALRAAGADPMTDLRGDGE